LEPGSTQPEGIVKTLGYLQQFKSWNVGWRSYTQPSLDTGNAMVTDIVLSVLSAGRGAPEANREANSRLVGRLLNEGSVQ